MPKSFAFNLGAAGTPGQYISLRFDGEPEIQVPVPDINFPDDTEPRFRAMYQALVDSGHIENNNPVFNA